MSKKADGPKRSTQGTFYPGGHGLTDGDTTGRYSKDITLAEFLERARPYRHCRQCLEAQVRLDPREFRRQLDALKQNAIIFRRERAKCVTCSTVTHTWFANERDGE